MTKLERLRKEIPADLPDDWSCIVRAGDARTLLDAVEALQEMLDRFGDERDPCEKLVCRKARAALAALDALEEP